MVQGELAALKDMLKGNKLYKKLLVRYELMEEEDSLVFQEPGTGFRVVARFEDGLLKLSFEYDDEELRDFLYEEDIDYVKELLNDAMLLIETIAYTASHKWMVVKDMSSILDLINILEEQE
ncbi:MAG: hypothetical protein F7C32_03420 [Desulfurococcales archaeon]|nr:hypothetical protein [Desulfurococcales archaeon]